MQRAWRAISCGAGVWPVFARSEEIRKIAGETPAKRFAAPRPLAETVWRKKSVLDEVADLATKIWNHDRA